MDNPDSALIKIAESKISELQRYATQLEAENERLMGIVEGQDKEDNLPSLRAEILKLRTGLARHLEFLDAIEVKGKKIVADNARLRKYVQHKATCLVYNRAEPHYCNCGLDAALKKI